jgi:hypothetical protein
VDQAESEDQDLSRNLENAVLIQIWIALCVYLVQAYLAFLSNIGASMQQILRLLQLNFFELRDFECLFKPPKIEASSQLALLYKL